MAMVLPPVSVTSYRMIYPEKAPKNVLQTTSCNFLLTGFVGKREHYRAVVDQPGRVVVKMGKKVEMQAE
jgi:hypothetical protein